MSANAGGRSEVDVLVPAGAKPLTDDDVATLHAAERLQLRTSLESLLATEPLDSSRVGVHVVSLDSGETLYAQNPHELLNPASNVKLVTAAAVLGRLGPEYRFETEFWCAQSRRGAGCNTLYIKGRGDPVLYTERIYGIVGELLHRGLSRVGDIVIDESFFDDVRNGPGWEQENTDRAYLAPTGAVSINHNAVAIHVTPASSVNQRPKVTVSPPSAFFQIDNQVRSVSSRSRRRLIPASVANGDRQRIVVSGRLPVGTGNAVFYRKIDSPPMYAGETFKAVLKERGVTVTGRVRTGVVPDDATLLYTSYSPALTEVVRELNKHSNNFIAEQLIKVLGAELKGAPGSWEKGIAAVEEYLAELGLSKGAYVMKNGSGLNDTNRFSAAQLTHLLRVVYDTAGYYPEFASSLGVAARDGTLRLRMDGTQAEGRLRGKTGTLENVSALSGYVRSPRGERLAYAILVNDFSTRHRPVIASIDRVAAHIAGLGRPEPWLSGATGTQVAEPANEVVARATTFANLGRMADHRNLPFLRSALRTERDPLLRAVLADAVYRSDPESGPGVLLENVPSEPDAFGRLRGMGQDLSIPTPLVSPIIDIAAEGHPEALETLLSLARRARGDEAFEALLTDGLQEIGRNAPDELFEALRTANAELADRAIELLQRGIAASGERTDHPFLVRLKQPADESLAPAAMHLYERIEQAMADWERSTTAQQTPACGDPSCVPTRTSIDVPGGG